MRPSRWPIRKVVAATGTAPGAGTFPANVPAVAHLLRDGLALAPATVLVGENSQYDTLALNMRQALPPSARS